MIECQASQVRARRAAACFLCKNLDSLALCGILHCRHEYRVFSIDLRGERKQFRENIIMTVLAIQSPGFRRRVERMKFHIIVNMVFGS
jgi:hypothetical protein